jgi:DNA-binding response OmpR family regulator
MSRTGVREMATSKGIAMAHSPLPAARVLIVDDDEGIRDAIRFILADEGLVISTAPTAWVALDMLEKDEFDLMVTDMKLPEGLNGLELVRYARGRHPSLKSLFVSSYPECVQDDPDLDNFVSKPFRGRELLGCVWELLSRELPKKPIACSSSRLAELAIVEAKIKCLRPRHREMPALHGVRRGNVRKGRATIKALTQQWRFLGRHPNRSV